MHAASRSLSCINCPVTSPRSAANNMTRHRQVSALMICGSLKIDPPHRLQQGLSTLYLGTVSLTLYRLVETPSKVIVTPAMSDSSCECDRRAGRRSVMHGGLLDARWGDRALNSSEVRYDCGTGSGARSASALSTICFGQIVVSERTCTDPA